MTRQTLTALLGATASLVVYVANAGTDDARVARGAYLAAIMDCGGCHTPRAADGAPIVTAGLSGGNVGFEIPGLGIFWASNLTPHKSGLKGWSTRQIVDAIRTGTRPDGRMLAPAMPWPSFAHLSDEDAEALALYLRSLPPAESTASSPVGSARDAKAPFYRVTLPE